jgi:hypothetical protein
VRRTPDRARGPLFIFRKIHLYGKTKKSTHGHQTAKPLRRHSPEPAEESNRACPTPRPLPYSILKPTLYQRAYPIPHTLHCTHYRVAYPILPTLHRVPRTARGYDQVRPVYPIPDSGRGTRGLPPPRPSPSSLPYTNLPAKHTRMPRRACQTRQVRPTYPTPAHRNPYAAPSCGAYIGEI